MLTSPAFARVISLLRKTKLSSRLIAAFLIISLLPSLVLAVFSNRIYARSIEKTASASALQTLQLLNNNALLVLGEYSSYLDKLSVSTELQSDLYNRRFNPGVKEKFTKDNPALSYMSAPELRSVVILDTEGNMLLNKGYSSFSVELFPEIIAATDAVSPKDYVVHCQTADRDGSVVICRKIFDNRYSLTHLGYIMLFLNSSIFKSSIFPSLSLGKDSEMFIANSNCLPVAFQNRELLKETSRLNTLIEQIDIPEGSTSHVGQIQDDDDLIIYVYSSRYELYMFSSVPYTTLYREVNWVRSLVLTITAVLLVICLLLSTAIYFSVIIPVNATAAVCKQSQTCDEVPTINDQGQDELALMSNSIDSMIRNNHRMMDELKESDRKKRDLELEMLKYQLNPHFLFNTLNTFKWIADINCLHNLRDGISSLADLLRSTLVQKEELVSIPSEVDSLRDYCTIQSLRYAGQFDVTYATEEASEDYRLPRFVLQPLMENAIIHGIKDKETVLHISVTGRVMGDRLHLEIADDGVGFDTSAVFDKEADKYIGIGLANVDSRLRLYFGDESRLTVRSAPGEGTVCSFSIPAMPREEDKTDVSNIVRG